MKKMTTQERFNAMYEHREGDRIPIIDGPWGSTIERWQREGMPEDISWVDYFDVDHAVGIDVDNSPRYEARTIEETDEYRVYTTNWGATMKSWSHATSTPEFMDFTIKDPDSWQEAKARMTPDRDRVPWDVLEKEYKGWLDKGYWKTMGFWFGFDVTHSWTVGTERLLMAMVTDPEWVIDMFNHFLDVNIALYEQVLAEGYTFDAIQWPDDMGYKLHQFFSLDTYRTMVKPVHQRAAEWAHSKGMKVRLHSCGDIRPLIPDIIDAGIDCLNPLEVKAGMDALKIKAEYGDKLVLNGGVNAVLWDKPDKIRAEMEAVIPGLKQGGGYIFSSDHSIPDAVSLEDFRGIIELAKELGSY
ncbi:uroporphyrinogen decarboxylase family protein [Planctomycetota bacterium]